MGSVSFVGTPTVVTAQARITALESLEALGALEALEALGALGARLFLVSS